LALGLNFGIRLKVSVLGLSFGI